MLVPGTATGRLMRLEANLSFWGGIDPATGRVIATGHPQLGEQVTGRILALERSIGSSSGSSILLELMSRGVGPAGLILGEPEQILTLGAVVAGEMGWGAIPVLQLPVARFCELPDELAIEVDGTISPRPETS